MNLFDEEVEEAGYISPYLSERVDTETTILQDITGGITAVAADFGVSVYNSLPFTNNIETADLLSRVNNNALDFYNENQSAVELASFVAGVVIPGGVAMKGLGALRAGSKGMSWFSNAGKVENLAKTEEAFKLGADGAKAYRAVRNEMLVRGAVNNTLDAAVTEAAIVLTMNAHPLMEDYMADPASNFGVGLLIGGAIGVPGGLIADAFKLRSIRGAANTEALTTVYKGTQAVEQGANTLDSFHVMKANIDSYKKIADPSYNASGLVKEVAAQRLLIAEDKLETAYKETRGKGFSEFTDAEHKELLDLISTDKRFLGTDSFQAFSIKDSPTKQTLAGKLVAAFKPKALEEGATAKELATAENVVYLREFDSFTTPKEAKAFTRASALGVTVNNLLTKGGDVLGGTERKDLALSLASSSTPSATIDKLYLEALSQVDNHKFKVGDSFRIDKGDLPMLNAVAARFAKDPDTLKATNFIIAKGDELVPATIDDVLLQATSAKKELIDNLLKRGVPQEAIVIRTNTPRETIAAYATSVANEESIKSLNNLGDFALTSYNDANKLSEYLSAKNSALLLKTNPNKVSFAQMQSKLDSSTGLTATLEMVDAVASISKAPIMKEFHDMFFRRNDMKPLMGMLRQAVGEFNNDVLGNSFITSSDFFLRDTSVGALVATIGKNVQSVSTAAQERITAPISAAFSKITSNTAERIEFNTAIALNNSLAGERRFIDGSFKVPVRGNDGKVTMEVAKFQGKEFVVQSPNVRAALEELQKAGPELLAMNNDTRKILGKGAINDIGFWVPSLNPVGKQLAYVFDSSNNTTKLLWGRTKEELVEATAAYKATIPADKKEIIKVFNRGEAEMYNNLNNRLDVMHMEIANVEQLKTGSTSSAIVSSNSDVFSEIIGGLDHAIESRVKSIASIMMHDVTSVLDDISVSNLLGVKNQPLSAVQRLTGVKDGAKTVKNILLSNNNLSANPFWKSQNENFETYTTYALGAVADVFDGALGSFGGLFKGKDLNTEAFTKLDYKTIAKELEDKGIHNPWKVFDEEAAKMYGLSNLADHSNSSAKLVYASNAFAATFALRVAEMAQPLVNIVSLPIMTSLAKAQSHPANFLGAQLSTAKVSTQQIMHEGVRMSHSEAGKKWAASWEESGYLDSFVSEANNVMRDIRSFDKGVVTKLEKALDSKAVELLSSGADLTEKMLRREVMFMGATLGKRLYPELNDTGVTIFARDFMDRAMGNYHAPQRPVFFQGTMGVGLGLFQTYMVTMGQNIYRHLELQNYKALAKASLLQMGVFGANSMPGFEQVSTAIADNFSDENYDLTTGTYRALPNSLADAIIYGLPSSLGPAIHTRGDLQPRLVDPTQGGINFAAVNILQQTYGFGANVVEALGAEGSDVGRSIGQALSLQSVNRPVARVAELFTRTSITSRGNTVASPEDVWTPVGIFSRLLSTRPLEEAKIRELEYTNTVYGQMDSAAKNKVLADMKTAIRNGTLNDERLAVMGEEYARNNGSATGWRSAVNTAVAETDFNSREHVLKLLKPDSPFMHMMNSRDGE